jgi:hypothetical protein
MIWSLNKSKLQSRHEFSGAAGHHGSLAMATAPARARAMPMHALHSTQLQSRHLLVRAFLDVKIFGEKFLYYFSLLFGKIYLAID